MASVKRALAGEAGLDIPSRGGGPGSLGGFPLTPWMGFSAS